jgi:hypothetical protein
VRAGTAINGSAGFWLKGSFTPVAPQIFTGDSVG